MKTPGTTPEVSNATVRLPIDLNDVDHLLSKELESLSFKERSQIQEEIHGVSSLCPKETPGMVEEALSSMQQYLDDIQHKPIYEQLSATSYLHTRDWKFL
jgi:hypothetical protein